MQVKTQFPRHVRELEHVAIPMSDGCTLGARIWLPDDAESDPVPAILEYIPYRKNDYTVARDATRQPYLAGHGYAAVRVDMRGSGDAEGVLLDEYLPQEQEDALEVIRWIADQPWCTGDVGMWGISWGGFNALQVAAHRPPELKAIITLCSTDDRYADDVHYRGGCVLAIDMLPWATSMLLWNATPPDPRWHGERWRDLWLERLERTPPFVEAWLAHQRRDGYWEQGSVCEDWDAVQCPVYAVGGWADGYTNAVPRLLANLRVPRKGLIGPWAHGFPEQASPGPSIGFLQETLRWWDRHLKGGDRTIDGEPLLRAWISEWVPPRADLTERPGRWVAEAAWPPARAPRRLALREGRLVPGSPEEGRFEVATPQATGLDSGLWCPYGNVLDLPPDQRGDDALSVVFDSDPLEERLEILGFPELRLRVSVDRPVALLAARLCDVAPDGSSLVVSRGLLNLTHRESHASPSPVEPGRFYDVSVGLDLAGYAFPPGHRVRLAVSTTYWPWTWPSPQPVRATVTRGELLLPEREPQAADEHLAPFEEPEGAPPLDVEELETVETRREVTREGDTTTLVYEYGGGRRLPDGIEIDEWTRETFAIVEGDPLSATVRVEGHVELARGDWRTRVVADTTMTSDAESFHVSTLLDAYEGEERVFSLSRPFSVPRDLV